MKKYIARVYAWVMARREFRRLNTYLAKIGLKGLGILYSNNPKENGEHSFLKRTLKAYDLSLVFDVGANKGGYAEMLLQMGYGGKIYCFEPHPQTFKNLSRDLENPNISLFNLGLSSKIGTATIYDHFNEDGSEHASLFKEVIETIHHNKAVSQEVALTTIDDFVLTHGIPKIDLLKIDTEGNEFNVLLGAVEALEMGKIDIIHLEFNEMNVVSRVFLKDFYFLLKGYNLYRLLPNGSLPISYDKSLFNELFSYQNIVAIRKDIDKYKT